MAGLDSCERSIAPLLTAPSGWPLRKQLSVVTLAWVFGAVWFSITTGAPLTLFAKALGATNFQFGLLASMPYVAALAALPGSLLAERTGGRKRIFLNAFYTQRVLWFVIAGAPVLMLNWYGPAAAPRAVALVLALMLLMYATGATGGPAWVSWMAEVVPQRVRGAYFARRRMWGIVSAVPAALLVGVGLDRFAGIGATSLLPNVPPIVFWCSALFMGVAFFGIADIACFQRMPHTPKPKQSGAGLLKAMTFPLKDRPFLTLSTFAGAINFTVGFTNQFATLYVIDRLKVDHIQAQVMLLVLPMAVQLFMLPAWGAAVDRMGKRPLMILAAAGLIPIGFGWMLMGQGGTQFLWLGYVLYAGGTALWTGMEVANFNAVIDASGKNPQAGGSGYVAVNTVIINVAGCLGGVSAGVIAQLLQGWSWQPVIGMRSVDFYEVLFAFSGTVRLLAVVLIAPMLVEPSARSVWQTAQFMARYTCDRVAAIADRWLPQAQSTSLFPPTEVES